MANTKITTAVIKDDAVTSAKIADDLALGGNPTTTTQSAGNNTTRIATTAFVTTAVANLVDSAPSALDTLNELAAAMGDDANFSTTITNSIATKLPLAGGTMTGTLNMGSQGITNLASLALNGDMTVTENDKIKTSESSGGSFLQLRSDSLGVTNNSTALIGLNDIVIGAKSNNSGTGAVYFGLGAEAKSDSNWVDTLTITQSGDVLVGRTSVGSTGAGHSIRGADSAIFSRDGGEALILNRDTDQGSLIELRQAGTARGLVGTVANDLFVTSADSGHNGLRFHASGILPTDNAGAIVDADADLGVSTHRFKDIYLSGGAFLGGTAAANHLDEYEEGNWTPVIQAGSASYGTAWFVRIGRLVTVHANVFSPSDVSTSNNVFLSGLPFASGAGSKASSAGSMISAYIVGGPYYPYVGVSSSTVYFYDQNGSVYHTMKHNDFTSNTDFHFTLSYFTDL